jgi:hypothetical protein
METSKVGTIPADTQRQRRALRVDARRDPFSQAQ